MCDLSLLLKMFRTKFRAKITQFPYRTIYPRLKFHNSVSVCVMILKPHPGDEPKAHFCVIWKKYSKIIVIFALGFRGFDNKPHETC